MDKQQEKELAVFRLMGETCAEKMHRSDSVLLNALRRKPAAAIVLQQAETGCAMEQELFQSQHASILEHGVTAQQSPSSSHKNSIQVNTPPRRARMPADDVDEEVSEELTSGKRIWNSAWLDSQEKSGVGRSALAENQINGACKYEVMFAGKRKIMRKDETTW